MNKSKKLNKQAHVATPIKIHAYFFSVTKIKLKHTIEARSLNNITSQVFPAASEPKKPVFAMYVYGQFPHCTTHQKIKLIANAILAPISPSKILCLKDNFVIFFILIIYIIYYMGRFMSVRLTGLIDKIVNALMSVIEKVFNTILQPIILLIYEVVIWVPLQVINALMILFRFFASGFMGTIFGGSFVNGKISYSFNPFGGSAFETIVFFVVVTSLIMFFIFLMASFISGLGPKGVGGKVFELKWIFISVAILIVSPAVFIVADALMTTLMKAFDGTDPTKITGDDVSNLYNYFLNGDFATIKGVGDEPISWVTDPDGFGFSQDGLLASLNELEGHLQDCINQIDTYKNNDSYDFGQLALALEQAQTDLTSCITYMTTTVTTDWNTFADMLATWNPGSTGMFISDDNATTIQTITGNLEDFQQSFVNLGTDYSLITNANCTVGWNTLDSFGGNWPTITAEVKAQFYQISESMADTSGADNQLAHYFSLSSSSVISTMTYGSTQYISLSSLYWCRQVSQPASVVQELYMVITGDTNPNNWDHLPKIGGKILGNISILQFVLGTFACWGMILIMYNFTSSAIKRTYYLIGYWLLGFYYLAGGTKGANATKKWYGRIWGKWIGIFVMYVCFTAASVVLDLIMPAINDSTSILHDPSYKIGGIEILVVLATILAIEAAYQTAYQVSQAYLKQFDAGDEKFQAESPLSIVTQGKALLGSALSSAEYWGTGGPVKDAYNKVDSYQEYWKKKYDTKLSREGNEVNKASRIVGMNKARAELNAAGYDFSNPHGSDPGKVVRLTHGNQARIIGGGGSGGGGNVAPAPAPADGGSGSQVEVPKNFVAYKDKDGNYLQGKENKWYNGGSKWANAKNLGRAVGSYVARGLEATHDAAAYVGRKLVVGNAIIGAAGVIGGERGRAQAQRIFGSSKNRISHAEKQFARQYANADGNLASTISKDTKTGLTTIKAPIPPLSRPAESSKLGKNGKIKYSSVKRPARPSEESSDSSEMSDISLNDE